ncbi:MAG: archaemetzincin family Zn-dependent metalloprotease [Bacteroidota bacterium]|nr:archaemetzincin family Zn-dependent metalloprotease [Bacteroidota bacterium]
MISIRLAPLIPVSDKVVNELVSPLTSIFQSEVSIEQSLRDLTEMSYDSSRAQYNSTSCIRELLKVYPDSTSKILGITSVDLFVPVLTYVFGEAQLDGTIAVMSTYRLDDALYGMEADPIIFFERVLKEAVHELGHTYGLIHCKNFECAMHSSTSVEDVDLKGAALCVECQKKIGIL